MRASTLILSVSISSLLVSCASSRVRDEDDLTDECGDQRPLLDIDREPIVNGAESWDPGVVDLSEGQGLAVGALMQPTGGEFANVCTATLVTPRLVVSAAHCVLDWESNPWNPGTLPPERVRFAVGEDAAEPVHLFEIQSVSRHPSYQAGMWGINAEHDVSALVLAEDATTAVSGLQPIPLNCSPLEETGLVGQDVQNVGYGVTEAGWSPPPNSRRYWTVEEVTELTSFDYTVYGHGVSGVCGGDSGGPTLWTMPDGVVRLIGTLSGGDGSCVDYDHFARADDNCDFFADFLEGCGDVTEGGSCEAGVAVFCSGGVVNRVDCAATGRSCGDDGSGNMRCSAEPGCGEETEVGRCEGDVAIFCADGEAVSQNCAAVGFVCGRDDAGAYRCLSSGSAECDELGYAGRCEGDDALWCEDGQVRRRRCADCLQECGWSETRNAHYCL